MHLSAHDLRQLDDEYVESLSSAAAKELLKRVLRDLKEAHERLNQTPENSSRPPSSRAPWEGVGNDEALAEECYDEAPAEPTGEEEEASPPVEADRAEEGQGAGESAESPKGKAGKRPGAPGYGRQVELAVTGEAVHAATACAGCGAGLGPEVFEPRTGLYVVDIEMGTETDPGLRLTHIKHLYGDSPCPCGHVSRTEPGRCEAEPEWEVALTEWHLAGPTLVALIVCLALRLRVSRQRIQEFLEDWLRLHLSLGTLNQCIHEAGRAVAPVEDQLVDEINASGLLHADETSWKEHGEALWLWVFTTMTTVLFLVGYRRREVIEAVLSEAFQGWLMSDGYHVYRYYGKRLRCWAHLLRKARGLKESVDRDAQAFGGLALTLLKDLMKAIYQAREGPPVNLRPDYAERLAAFQAECERLWDAEHTKTRELAREFLHDWKTIWIVLEHPHLPLTNNEAEQALRHWVLARKISHGTRSEQGSRAFALLASVIETCRLRKISPWPYLAQVIAERRKGREAPPLPAPAI